MTLPLVVTYIIETLIGSIYTDENGNILGGRANGLYLANGSITANPNTK